MLTEKQKELLKDFTHRKCEICKKRESELNRLVVHHIHRKVSDGKDNLQNLKILCEDCHRTIHRGELV